MNNTVHGVIYCRVSSKEQAEGTSLQSQELACREFARAKDIAVLKVFVERGESAKFADRTQLLELIDFCRQNKGKVQVLIVWKVDRFARNVADHFNVKATLMKYGVRIMSVTEPIDTNPEGKLMETILAGFAQFDNDIRAMRTVQGMRRRIQEGIHPWHPPLGYKSSTKNGENKTEPDQPDQPVFELLQKAWREFATGAYTKAEIRRLMATRGIVTKKGQPLSPQSIDHLFANPFYAGILVDPWSDEEHEGRHVPMVTRGQFAQVQQIIARRNRSVPHQKERPEFPIRGLVRCDGCEQYMTASFSRGRSKRYPYYHCKNRTCARRGKGHPAETAHSEYWRLLDQLALKPQIKPEVEQMILQAAQKRHALATSQKSRIRGEMGKVEKEIQELIRMRAGGLITDAEFLHQKGLVLNRRLALETATVDETYSPGQVKQQLSQIMGPLVRLRQTWDELPDPLRRRFDRLVLPVGFVIGKSRTAQTALIFRVSEPSQGGTSNGVALLRQKSNRIWQEIQEFLRLFEETKEVKKA